MPGFLFYQSMTSSTIARCSVEVLRRYMRVVSILSCPIRSARNAMSLQRSKKLFAKRWRKECGYTTAGSMPYRTASFFSCPEMPLVVILSPYLFKKMKPLSWCLSFSQERASFCRALGMYIRRSLKRDDFPHTVSGQRVYIDKGKFLSWLDAQTQMEKRDHYGW